MGRNEHVLDPKLEAVLARLCERRGSLTKTQAAKLPYLVDVVAHHVLGRRITRGTHETWRYGVVTAEVWRFAKTVGVRGPFKIDEPPRGEGRVIISLAGAPPDSLTPEERAVVDVIADEFGSFDYDGLGKLTKAMNVEFVDWENVTTLAKVDDEAYNRLAERWDKVIYKLEQCNTEDTSTWERVTGASVHDIRQSLGV